MGYKFRLADLTTIKPAIEALVEARLRVDNRGWLVLQIDGMPVLNIASDGSVMFYSENLADTGWSRIGNFRTRPFYHIELRHKEPS